MTVIALDVDRASIDSAVSAEAKQVAKQLATALEYRYSESVARPLAEAMEALWRTYSRAARPDWDGEGAAAMQPGSVRYAEAFLRALPSALPLPYYVGADPDGDVYLEWDSGRHSVMTVSIGPEGSLHYACLWGATRFHGADLFTDRVPSLVVEGIARVTGHRQD